MLKPAHTAQESLFILRSLVNSMFVKHHLDSLNLAMVGVFTTGNSELPLQKLEVS